MNSYEQFAQSLKKVFSRSFDLQHFLVFLVIVLIIFLVYFLIRAAVNQYNTLNKIKGSGQRSYIPHDKFNAMQKKIAQDMILQFKKNELKANAVPSYVLEHFTEYIYANKEHLEISDNIARDYGPVVYPMGDTNTIELEIDKKDDQLIFERNIIHMNDKSVIIRHRNNQYWSAEKGEELIIYYVVNDTVIGGRTTVQDILPDDLMVLEFPKDLHVLGERRHPRIPLHNAIGYLVPVRTGEDTVEIKLIDISKEGVRLHPKIPIKEKEIYYLNMQDHSFDEPISISNVECIISKIIFTETNETAYGLSFVYLDAKNQELLAKYLSLLTAK